MDRLETQIEKIQEVFNMDLEELKNKQSTTKNEMTEIKNTLEGINSRVTDAEEWISELKDIIVYISTAEQDKEKEWG